MSHSRGDDAEHGPHRREGRTAAACSGRRLARPRARPARCPRRPARGCRRRSLSAHQVMPNMLPGPGGTRSPCTRACSAATGRPGPQPGRVPRTLPFPRGFALGPPAHAAPARHSGGRRSRSPTAALCRPTGFGEVCRCQLPAPPLRCLLVVSRFPGRVHDGGRNASVTSVTARTCAAPARAASPEASVQGTTKPMRRPPITAHMLRS